MKHWPVILFAFFTFIASGCKQVDKLLTFNINQSQTITVPKVAVIPGITVTGAPVTVTTDSQEEYKKQNTAVELVKDVMLTKIELNMETPANEDFGFLKNVELFIGADNLPEERMAHLHDIPADAGRTLKLTSTNLKLDKYLKAPSFTLRTRGTADETILNDITVRVDMTFKVTAAPL